MQKEVKIRCGEMVNHSRFANHSKQREQILSFAKDCSHAGDPLKSAKHFRQERVRWKYLRIKLLAAQGRPLQAAKIALQHAKANPTGFYAAELLYRASENFKAAHEPTQANAAMDLLTTKYPESPYARGTPNPE